MNKQRVSKKVFLVGTLLSLIAVILVGYAMAGVPIPNGDPDPQVLVGELLGQVAVDNTGAASYSVPIDVSPGTAGMEPKLAISYSSQRGNGLLGVGFSVDGLSGIVRSSSTRHHDGFIDGVDFDGNDRFMLDGQRLILVSSGSYGDDDSEYRTEIDSFSRIILHGGMNDATSYFTVETKSGLVMEYGHATGAMKPDGRTENISWLIDRVADTAGNYMQYVYTNHVGTVGELLLDRIEYTLNDGMGLAAANRVEFVYESRPDTLHGFKAGSEFNRTQRLERIRVMHASEEVCNYQLDYVQNNSNVSLLKSVQKFIGVDSIPKTVFDWNSEGAAEGWSANYPEFAPVLPLAKTVIQEHDGGQDELFIGRAANLVSDFNGDGLTDVLYSEYWGSTSAEVTSTNTGMGFSSFATDPVLTLFHYRFFNDISLYDESDLYDPGYRLADLNGDGLLDIMSSWGLYRIVSPYDSFVRKDAWLNNGSGGWNESVAYKPSLFFSFHFNNTATRPILDSGIRFEDLNADGLSDMLASYYINGQWYTGAYTNNNGNGFDLNTAYQPPVNFVDVSARYNHSTRFLDLNGDGLVDIVNANPYWPGVRLNAGNGWEIQNSTAYALPYNLVDGSGHDIGTRFVDVNGDGLVDVLNDTNSVYLNTGTGWLEDTNGVYTLPENTILGDKRLLTKFVDLNGDGLDDLIFMNGNNSPTSGYVQRTHLNTGHGWDLQTNAVYALPHPFARSHDGHTAPLGQFFQDLDGDGLIDYFYNHRWMKRSASGGYYDQGETEGAVLNQGTFGNLLTKVTKGWRSETVHGLATELDYRPITDKTIYIKGSNQSFPYRDVQAALYVVTEQRRDDGVGGMARTLYTYSEAISHRDRGFLGFRTFESYDVRKQLAQIDTLKQYFPHTGSTELSQTYYIPNTNDFSSKQLIKQVENTYLYDNVAGGTVFPYVGTSVEARWDYTTAGTRELVSTNATYNWFDGQALGALPPSSQPGTLPSEITHGNLTQVRIEYGDGSTEVSVNSYTSNTSGGKWHIGRLQNASVTHDHPNKALVVKSSSFTYDPITGLLDKEISEPGHATLELTTDYQYDGFGNITKKMVSGANIATRNVQQSVYDPQGRFVVETRNALDHKETIEEYDPQLGLVLRKKGQNGVETAWQHDAMGRTTLETRADATTTSTSYEWTASNAYVTLTFDDPGGAGTLQVDSPYKITITSSGAPTGTVWFDRKGREVRAQTTGPDGRTILQDSVYNTLGQTIAVSEPYFSGDAVLYTRTTYDPLERPLTVTLPDDTINKYTYDGLEATAIVDSNLRSGSGADAPKHQTSTTEKNLRGQIVKVTDALSKDLVYEYHADGTLHKTTAPGGIVTEILYDLRGNKTWQSDPDMGDWSYVYNALGELTSQTDAKSQTTTMLYDLLGRMYQRNASDGVAKWFFDNEGEGGKLGALHREELFDGTGTNMVYRKTHAYDSLGRPHFDLMNYDNKWYYNYIKYDGFSRVEETHRFWRPQSVIASGDNLSPDWNSFGTINTYDTIGTVLEVRDTKNNLWWSRNAADYTARGNLTQFALGNGVVHANIYDLTTGRMVGLGISNTDLGIFDQGFGYDRIGNLTSRSLTQTLQTTLSETFGYDAVNRLLNVGGSSSSVTVTYDNTTFGNRIASKTGIGNYTYGQNGAGPHAITSAAGISYLYDDNGNLSHRSIGGSNTTHVTWSSFNKPLRIDTDAANPTGSEKYSEFTYGIDHSRITQIIRDGSTLKKKIYIGGMEQEETSPNLTNPVWTHTETRIFIATPSGVVGVHVQDAAEQITRKYFHKDHLGSIIAVTDSSGQTLAEYSYNGWGNRRNAQDWTQSAFGNHQSAMERGFTGHEMLDNVELVHMNGRIYDPVIGLFLSADSFIQSPYNLQNYNRYGYVLNNPLTLTDPSGHFWALIGAWLGAAYGIVAGAIVSTGIFLAANPIVVGTILGGISGGMNGGIRGAIMGAFMGGVITGLFAGPQVSVFGSPLLSDVTKILAQGVVQGGMAEISGGDFGPAFLAGFAGAALGTLSGSIPLIKYNSAAGLIAAAVIGGTASELGGGKFANGAITGSFAYLLSTGMDLKKLGRDALSLVKGVGGTLHAGWYTITTWNFEVRSSQNSAYEHWTRDEVKAHMRIKGENSQWMKFERNQSLDHQDPFVVGDEIKYVHKSGAELVFYQDGTLVVNQYRGTYNHINAMPIEAVKWYNPFSVGNFAVSGAGHGVVDWAPFHVLGLER